MIRNRISVIKGDITKLEVDAVVNAANSGLRGGGGVDGAIHRAAGNSLILECMEIIAKQGSCPTGQAVITSAGNMPAKYVIHAVGPVWYDGNADEHKLLESAYRNCLLLAKKHGIKSIAFPNISTGIYGFPKTDAAEIAVKTVSEFLASDICIDKVIFCCFEQDNFELYKSLIK